MLQQFSHWFFICKLCCISWTKRDCHCHIFCGTIGIISFQFEITNTNRMDVQYNKAEWVCMRSAHRLSEDFRVHKMSDELHKSSPCALPSIATPSFLLWHFTCVRIYKWRGMRIASHPESLLMFLLMLLFERIAIRLLMLLLQLLVLAVFIDVPFRP